MFYHEGPQVILQGRISRTEIQQIFDNGEVIINEWKNGQNHRKRGKTLTKEELEELYLQFEKAESINLNVENY